MGGDWEGGLDGESRLEGDDRCGLRSRCAARNLARRSAGETKAGKPGGGRVGVRRRGRRVRAGSNARGEGACGGDGAGTSLSGGDDGGGAVCAVTSMLSARLSREKVWLRASMALRWAVLVLVLVFEVGDAVPGGCMLSLCWGTLVAAGGGWFNCHPGTKGSVTRGGGRGS